jgi:hypothetical protein
VPRVFLAVEIVAAEPSGRCGFRRKRAHGWVLVRCPSTTSSYVEHVRPTSMRTRRRRSCLIRPFPSTSADMNVHDDDRSHVDDEVVECQTAAAADDDVGRMADHSGPSPYSSQRCGADPRVWRRIRQPPPHRAGRHSSTEPPDRTGGRRFLTRRREAAAVWIVVAPLHRGLPTIFLCLAIIDPLSPAPPSRRGPSPRPPRDRACPPRGCHLRRTGPASRRGRRRLAVVGPHPRGRQDTARPTVVNLTLCSTRTPRGHRQPFRLGRQRCPSLTTRQEQSMRSIIGRRVDETDFG